MENKETVKRAEKQFCFSMNEIQEIVKHLSGMKELVMNTHKVIVDDSGELKKGYVINNNLRAMDEVANILLNIVNNAGKKMM